MKAYFSRAWIAANCLLVLALAAAAQSQGPPQSKAKAPLITTNTNEGQVAGLWAIDVEATADNLARAEFSPHQEVTIQRGMAHPITNVVTKPFDKKAYQQSRKIWIKGLKEPGMQWQLILKPDHTGEHIATDEESHRPKANPVKWELNGSELRLEYPEEKRFNHFTAYLASKNELHYPMEPLGGWIILRRKEAARNR